MTKPFFELPVVKNPTRADAGRDSVSLKTDRLSVRLGGNTGNVAFIHAILGQIAKIKHVSEVRRGYGDINVLGCSNQINRNINKSADDAVFDHTDAPFVAIGLGAQAPSTDEILEIPEGTIGFIRRIQDSAPGDEPNISVRGHYTYQVLQQAGLHERAVALGCPSLFTHPNPKLGLLISRTLQKSTERIAVAPGNIFNGSKTGAVLERSLATLASIGGGGYVVQHPKELMALVRDGFNAVDEQSVERIRAYVRPDLDGDEFRRWFRNNARMFTSAVSWMEYLRSVDLVVGTRIHGCMLAIQAARPALCIALDSRQTELCEIMHIPSISAADCREGIDRERVVEVLATHDWLAFDENRRALAAKYRSFLHGNRLPTTRLLNDLAEAPP
jgi:hypothetical protein